MDPKSALFFTTKILRIPCKKQCQGHHPHLPKLTQKMVFIFLTKNVIFHNPRFYLSKTEVSEGQESFFEGFGVHVLVHFLDLFFFALSVILSQPMVLLQ